MNAYHFCAEFNESPGVMLVFDGIVTSDSDVFAKEFYDALKTKIAGAMTPPRPMELVTITSLSRIA